MGRMTAVAELDSDTNPKTLWWGWAPDISAEAVQDKLQAMTNETGDEDLADRHSLAQCLNVIVPECSGRTVSRAFCCPALLHVPTLTSVLSFIVRCRLGGEDRLPVKAQTGHTRGAGARGIRGGKADDKGRSLLSTRYDCGVKRIHRYVAGYKNLYARQAW